MPRERWEALVRGEDCPLCAAVAATERQDQYGVTVADLRLSRLRLAANQAVAGYCVLICARHVREPYELDRTERDAFFNDLMIASRAIETVFQPLKMNFQILGNLIPHLHCHLVPRYYGDPAPGRPLDPDHDRCLLASEEYERRRAALHAALPGR